MAYVLPAPSRFAFITVLPDLQSGVYKFLRLPFLFYEANHTGDCKSPVTSEVTGPVTQQFLVTGGVARNRKRGERSESPSVNPASLLGRKSGERKDGDRKRRLSERSEFLRFRRTSFHSRLKSAAGDFSFCYLFLFFGKKKK